MRIAFLSQVTSNPFLVIGFLAVFATGFLLRWLIFHTSNIRNVAVDKKYSTT